jgi:hypothetical protein
LKVISKIFLFLSLVNSTILFAQKRNPPPIAKTVFDSLFPKAEKVEWDTGKYPDYDTITFKTHMVPVFHAYFDLNKQSGSATFDSNGIFIQAHIHLQDTCLPTKALEYLKNKYPKFLIIKTVYLISKFKVKTFLVFLCPEKRPKCDENPRVLFDEQGNFLTFYPWR